MFLTKFKYVSIQVSDTIPLAGFTIKDIYSTNKPELIHTLNRVLRDFYPDGQAPFGHYSLTFSKELFGKPRYDLQFFEMDNSSLVTINTVPNRLTGN